MYTRGRDPNRLQVQRANNRLGTQLQYKDPQRQVLVQEGEMAEDVP